MTEIFLGTIVVQLTILMIIIIKRIPKKENVKKESFRSMEDFFKNAVPKEPETSKNRTTTFEV